MAILIYFLAVFLVSLLALVVAFAFYRYRFQGDKTVFLISLMAAMMLANVIFTLSLVGVNSVIIE
jgi:ABC-type spermidine/putrescine transport system permease subunit II